TSLYSSQIAAKTLSDKMSDNFLTLAEYMKNNFYNTIAVVSHIVVSKVYGFSQGFNTFNQEHIAQVDELSSEIITKQAVEYISQNTGNKFFLWVHYFDPHHNFINHTEYDYDDGYSGTLPDNLDNRDLNKIISSLNGHDIEYVKNIYDEEISYTDKHIGELIDSINNLGLSNDTVIVLTADHGEAFMERSRFGHGHTLYQELIRIPLISYAPGELEHRGKRVKENVETRSIPYTILKLIGIENDLFGGINLLEITEQENSGAFSEGSYAWGKDHRKEGIMYENWKLIKNLDDQSYELYDLEKDPYEKINLFNTEQINIKSKQDELMSKLSKHKKQRLGELQKVELSKEDIKRLKALGYIQ
ncbi:MAG: sulfatase-like hydrolase/transferase, partial [Candidatus Dadabacteria bacterium]|nr:sulfatase-like hydrolase/transferase [Candidatus Dadabacteria bacterium]